MWVRNYATNGVFWRDSNTDDNKATCQNPVARTSTSPSTAATGCSCSAARVARSTKSEGWGHGDSAYYVGATPFQKNPQKTVLKNLEAYKNVLGYSGTNSKYVEITTRTSTTTGPGSSRTRSTRAVRAERVRVIKDNNIFWNNFNYFLPNSPVKTVSDGLGDGDGSTTRPASA